MSVIRTTFPAAPNWTTRCDEFISIISQYLSAKLHLISDQGVDNSRILRFQVGTGHIMQFSRNSNINTSFQFYTPDGLTRLRSEGSVGATQDMDVLIVDNLNSGCFLYGNAGNANDLMGVLWFSVENEFTAYQVPYDLFFRRTDNIYAYPSLTAFTLASTCFTNINPLVNGEDVFVQVFVPGGDSLNIPIKDYYVYSNIAGRGEVGKVFSAEGVDYMHLITKSKQSICLKLT